jgi:hypothetical protein
LATVVLGTVIFISCSDEGSTVTPGNSMLNYRITDANAFINEFYGISWRTGTSTSVRDSLNAYVVTEIIVDTDTRARGYLVKDEEKGDLLYFADVDRTGYVMKTVDLVTEEWETITNIDQHPDYHSSDEFDIIKIIGGVIGVQPMGWFWGTHYTDCTSVTVTDPDTLQQTCQTDCVKQTRRFGFTVRQAIVPAGTTAGACP